MQHYRALDNTLHILDDGIDPDTVANFPSGATLITEEEARALLPKPSLAKVIEIKKQEVREARKPVFYTLAGMQSEALAKSDGETADAILAIQQALKELPDIDLTACVTEADVNAAFVAAWLAIANSAPANVVSAFNEVLA